MFEPPPAGWRVLPPLPAKEKKQRGAANQIEEVRIEGSQNDPEVDEVVVLSPLRERVLAKVAEVPDISGKELIEVLGVRREELYGKHGLLSVLVGDEALVAFPCGSGCTRCAHRSYQKVHYRVPE